MAETYLRQEDLKALDQTRQRLFQLASNIGSLKADVQQSNPLPQWSVISVAALVRRNETDNPANTGNLCKPLPRS
jgi:hypothetical protein